MFVSNIRLILGLCGQKQTLKRVAILLKLHRHKNVVLPDVLLCTTEPVPPCLVSGECDDEGAMATYSSSRCRCDSTIVTGQ